MALCNFIYKVITKILANRLKLVFYRLVSLWQSAFIPGRAMHDNIIIAHECMHYFYSKTGKLGYIALKIDMAKAYDKVDWNFLLRVLKLHGFEESFISWIKTYISSPMFSILVNSSPFGYFSHNHGITQEGPISPPFFTIFFYVLSRLLLKVEAEGRIHGVKVSRNSPLVTHVMFTYDLTIFVKVSIEEAREVKSCLDKFCSWAG